jgi:hypothetical protein
MQSYFNENPTYVESYFRRVFWMSIKLFKHIAIEVMKFDRLFEQRRNAVGGHSTYQKVTAALRMGDKLAMGDRRI